MKTNYIQPQTIVVLTSSDLMKITDGGSAGSGLPSQPGFNKSPLRNINTLYI